MSASQYSKQSLKKPRNSLYQGIPSIIFNLQSEDSKESDSDTQSSTPNRDISNQVNFGHRSKYSSKLFRNKSEKKEEDRKKRPLTKPRKNSTLLSPTCQESGFGHLMFNEAGESQLMETFMAFSCIKRLPKVDLDLLERLRVEIPRKIGYEEKKTVIFDLDETLIHCECSTGDLCDVILTINENTVDETSIGLKIRPFALECLRAANKFFEVLVFTASQQTYADAVLDYLDTEGLVHYRLYRENCVKHEHMFVKDLRVINRELKDVIIVDNAVYSFGYQIDNGIPIKSWFGDADDTELMKLTRYFEILAEAPDVRKINRETFRLFTFCEEEKVEEEKQVSRQKVRNLYRPRTLAKRV